MIVIGITGTLGAGKGTVTEYLIGKGFAHYSSREFIINEVIKEGLEVNRDTVTRIGNSIRERFGPGFIVEAQYHKALLNQQDKIIIESIRTRGEVGTLRNIPNSFLIAVDAYPEVRYTRIKERNSALDNISFEKFVEDEKREWQSDDPGKQSLGDVIPEADYVITNNEGIEELNKQTEKILKDIEEKVEN